MIFLLFSINLVILYAVVVRLIIKHQKLEKRVSLTEAVTVGLIKKAKEPKKCCCSTKPQKDLVLTSKTA